MNNINTQLNECTYKAIINNLINLKTKFKMPLTFVSFIDYQLQNKFIVIV